MREVPKPTAAEPATARALGALQRVYGIARSAAIYRAQPWKRRRARALYGQFVKPNELCFDIGAHLGDRVGYFRKLGARVVAVEPQPALMVVLRRLYGREPGVALIEAALGAAPGTATLYVDPLNPSVATLSERWAAVVGRSTTFRRVQWRDRIVVPVTTLDDLIARHGLPAFCKIDVEGLEAEVLRGLSRPLAALSFEYVAAAIEVADAAVACLAALGDYEFNRSPGESLALIHQRWRPAAEMAAELQALRAEGGSGDVYARRRVSP